jgi:hypothetical protein
VLSYLHVKSSRPSAVSATVPTTKEDDCNNDASQDEDELHDEGDEDEMLRMTDTLSKIMV